MDESGEVETTGGPRWWADTVIRGFVLAGITLAGVLAGFTLQAVGHSWLHWAAFGVAFVSGGVPSAIAAWNELIGERKLNVDLLMVVAALGAASVGQAGDGAILLFLFSLSNALQAWAFGRTRNAIRALMKLHPEGATVLDADGRERWVRLAELRPGDTVLVRPGERFPADGRLADGYTSADESALTGESVPVDKSPGDGVFGGTLNGEGVVRARIDRPASESALARLVRLVEDAQAAKGPTEVFAARFEGPYTIGVLLSVPVVFFALHLLGGIASGPAWYRAMTFLVVASPCAVVISTPAAVLAAMAAGARNGTLFKSGAALEALAAARIVAFDKTGTLTEGRMHLVEVAALEGTEDQARALAAGLERHSEHPVARAIVSAWTGDVTPVADVQAVRGHGIRGVTEGETVWAGSRRMAAAQGAAVHAEAERRLAALENAGVTPIVLGRGARVTAVLGVADTPRPEAPAAVHALRERGVRVVMLTGDREPVARHIAADLGIDEVRAELLPEHKLDAIAELRRDGRVAMVGDGVNDAPALAAADVGVAMGSGSDVSLESADLVLMKSDLSRIAGAVGLARKTAATIRFNLAFAMGVIVIVGTLSLFGRIPLPLGVVAHEGGTIFVVTVGLRLLAYRFGRKPERADVRRVAETARRTVPAEVPGD
ncbi:MAG TPA: heavy metal translocating P-type ATPase [Longimicrobium sp.]|nr:heavy metal translocating P-type ATPase [Longimicrobium sp.]